MTKRRLLTLVLLSLLGLPFVAVAGPTACEAADELPPDVVAIVRAGPEDKVGRRLTFQGFCVAAAQQALADIKKQRSGARAVLEQLIEELMVVLACDRLGIVVTEADMQRLWNELDAKVRRRSGGMRTLRETIKQEGTTEGEFREQLFHLIRKERIATHTKYLGKRGIPANEQAKLQQIGIVIATLRNKTKIAYGILTIDHVQKGQKPQKLAPGVVATVDDRPITMEALGRALVLRLPGAKVREYLDRECKTALMTMQGIGLSDKELREEVDYLEKLWPLERELKRDEVWKTVSFKDRMETQFNMTLEDVMKDRYARGLLGLVRTMRSAVTDAEIQEEYKAQKAGAYGPYLLADVVELGFSQREGFNKGGRSLLEARRLANGYARRLARGEAWERVASEINMKRDRSQRARTLRLTKIDDDRVHYAQCERLNDNDVSTPYETLAEICVMRRVGARPGRTLAEVAPHARGVVARRKAREWIGKKVKDKNWVQIRWPIPQRERGK